MCECVELCAGKGGVVVDVFEGSKNGDKEAVVAWLSKTTPATVNITDNDGASPLMFAAMRGHVVRKTNILIIFSCLVW